MSTPINLTYPGLDGQMFAQDGIMHLTMLRPGHLTAHRLLVSETPLAPSQAALLAYAQLGWTPSQQQQLTVSLRPRPVYALRAPAGEIALLFGPPLADGETPTAADDDLPLNRDWFREALNRPVSPVFSGLCDPSVSTSWQMSVAAVEWATGKPVIEKSIPQGTYNLLTDDVLALWRDRTLLGGVNMVLRGQRLYGPASLRVTYSNSALPPAFVESFRSVKPVKVMDTAFAAQPVPQGVTSWGSPLAVLSQTFKPYQCPANESFGTVGGWGWNYEPTTGRVGTPYTMATKWRLDPAFAAPGVDLQDLQRVLDAFGPLARAAKCGSWFPFPLTSRRIGYVHGLPSKLGVIVWSGTPVPLSVTELGVEIRVAYTDVTGKVYKELYPIDTLPVEQQATVQTAWDELPDDIQFRVGLFPGGLKYGAVTYDETKLARDIERANDVLDTLLFDSIEDGKPPVGYGSLGAKSLVAIAKKRNVAAAIVLNAAGEGLVSPAPLSIESVGGEMVIFQSGHQLTEGEAMIVIRSGGTVSFGSGITADLAAQTLFGLPTWSDVVNFEEGAQSRDYVVDENTLTDELQFDVATDDEKARALPLILGFDRADFAYTVASSLSGYSTLTKVR